MRLVAFDTETELIANTGDKVRSYIDHPEMVCLATHDGDVSHIYNWDDTSCQDLFTSYMFDGKTVFVAHNIPFDIGVLVKWYPPFLEGFKRANREGRLLDTMTLYKLRDVRGKGLKLEQLVWSVLGRRVKGKGSVQKSFRRDTPMTQEQVDYAKDDVVNTYDLAHRLLTFETGTLDAFPIPRHWIRAEQDHLLEDGIGPISPTDRLFNQANAARAWNLEANGWRLDQDGVEDEMLHAGTVLDMHATSLHGHGLLRWERDTKAPSTANPAPGSAYQPFTSPGPPHPFLRVCKEMSTTQPGKWVKDDKAIKAALKENAARLDLQDVPTSTKTGEISRTKDYWNMYRDDLTQDVVAFLKYARAGETLSMLKGWLGKERIFPRIHIPGAANARWSTSGPTTQNITKKKRYLLLPPTPGHVVVGVDYPTLELYTLAHAMKCLGIEGPLMRNLEAGVDLHIAAAQKILGKEDISDDERQRAKAMNFGAPGGRGARSLHRQGKQQYGLTWTFDEAYNAFWGYMATNMDVVQYLNIFKGRRTYDLFSPEELPDVFEALGFDHRPSERELTDAMDYGRVYNCLLPCGHTVLARRFCEAANVFFSALGAFVFTRAFVLADQAGLRIIGAVHDALYAEAAPEEAPAVGEELIKCMADALVQVCPSVPRPEMEYTVKETFF